MINLKVMIISDTGTETMTKRYRFPATSAVIEANQQLRESIPGGGQDMALFKPKLQPGESGDVVVDKKKKRKKKGEEEPPAKLDMRGVWLKPNRTLESYDLGGDDVVYFRHRHKVIKVKTADEATKAVLVDLMQNVKEVINDVGKKFNLESTEEYALQFENNGAWLNQTKPITEQGDPDNIFVLKKRFYINDATLDVSSPVQLHLAYIQGRDGIVSGMNPTTKDEAVLAAALQAQIEHGIFNPHVHKPGFLELEKYIPPDKMKIKDMEACILRQWKGLGSMDTQDLKHKYHKLCKTLATYGQTIYTVTRKEMVKKKRVDVVYKLGFTSTEVLIMNEDCKVVLKHYPYDYLRRWQFTSQLVKLDFGEFCSEGPFVFDTKQGPEIGSLIAGYIDIRARLAKSTGKELEEKGDIAQLQDVGTAHGRAAVGMTTSVSSGFGGVQNIGGITDLASFQKAFESFNIPTLKDLSSSSVGTALTFEQLSKQMESQGSQIMKLCKQMETAVMSKNDQELSNLSKNMAMVIQNLLQDAQRAAVVAKDPAHKQRLLDSTKTVVTALREYTEALKAVQQDPSDENKRRLALARAGLDNACESVMAAMRNVDPDPDMGDLLLQLARNVSLSVDELLALRDELGPFNPTEAEELRGKCIKAQSATAEFVKAAEILGEYSCDPIVRAVVKSKMEALEPLVGDVASSTGFHGRGNLIQQNISADLALFEDLISNSAMDIDQALIPYLRAAKIALDESEHVISDEANDLALEHAAALRIKDTVPVIVARAKTLGEDTADGSGARLMEAARQFALATRELVEKTEGDKPDFAQAKKAANAINHTVHIILGDDELLMHKAILLDRSKRAALGALKLASATRQKAAKSSASKDLLAASRAANKAVQDLLASVRRATGDEGDERVNLNSLSEQAERFCDEMFDSVLDPVRAADAELIDLCDTVELDVQELFDETDKFAVVGRLADIEYALEPFRAAEAMLTAITFANEAERFPPTAPREELLKELAPAVSEFGQSIKEVQEAAREGASPCDPLNDLACASRTIMAAVRGLVSTSRFKRERNLLVDTARQLVIDMNKLVGTLNSLAKGEAEGTGEKLADAVSGSVAALHRIVALAEQEGGKALVIDSSDLGEGIKCDPALEAKAEQTLGEAQVVIDEQVAHLASVSAELGSRSDQNTAIESAICDAIQALVKSTGSVVGSARESQQELIKNLRIKTNRHIYARDPALAQGLIDAAKHLLSSVRDLTRGLEADSISTISQSELANNAEEVSKSVEILASAVRAGVSVKNDTLVNAAKAVTESTKALLDAAKMIESRAEVTEESEDMLIDEYTMLEIKQQMKIAELERLLKKAKHKFDELDHVVPGGQGSWKNA